MEMEGRGELQSEGCMREESERTLEGIWGISLGMRGKDGQARDGCRGRRDKRMKGRGCSVIWRGEGG